MRQVKVGSTDISHPLSIVDSGDGTPETGVTAASAGLALEYVRNGAAAVALTESDLAAVDSAHTDGGIKHIGYGTYRVDWPDAAFAAGVDTVELIGTVTGMVVLRETIQLVGYNPRTELTSAWISALTTAAATIASYLDMAISQIAAFVSQNFTSATGGGTASTVTVTQAATWAQSLLVNAFNWDTGDKLILALTDHYLTPDEDDSQAFVRWQLTFGGALADGLTHVNQMTVDDAGIDADEGSLEIVTASNPREEVLFNLTPAVSALIETAPDKPKPYILTLVHIDGATGDKTHIANYGSKCVVQPTGVRQVS